MRVDDFFYDGKSRVKSPFRSFSSGGVDFIETIPDLVDAFPGNSDSGVFYGDEDFSVAFCGFYVKCRILVTEFLKRCL